MIFLRTAMIAAWCRFAAASFAITLFKQYLTGAEARTFASHATAPRSDKSAFLHRNLRRTDGRAQFCMITKLTVVDWPRHMRMPREGQIPVAVMNGHDDPFLTHAYIAGLQYGRIRKGRTTDIANGKHAPFFNQPEAFNAALEGFIAWAVQTRAELDTPAAS